MRYLQPVERRDDAKQVWQEIENNLGKSINTFLRHYAIHRYNYNNDKKKGVSVYKSIQSATKGRGVDSLLDDIRLKSIHYARILVPAEEDQVESEVFTFFRKYRVEQFRPLILSLMHRYANEEISKETYHTALKFLYAFFICYKIIGEENSNKLSDTVYKYAYLIETDFSAGKLDECMSSLKGKLPTLDSFTNSFRNIGFSNHWDIYNDSRGKERCKLILELIEKYVSNREINMEVTIEHVLPDCESIENQRLETYSFWNGNLMSDVRQSHLKRNARYIKNLHLCAPEGLPNDTKGKTSTLQIERTSLQN